MTEPQTHDPAVTESTSADSSPPEPPLRPTVSGVLRQQRKVIVVAGVLVVACFWVMGPLGEWRTAALTAFGIVLALVNHLASELWLGRLISAGEEPTRGSIAASAFTRLAVLSVVAVGVAVAFWPHGVGLLLGLAIFRLIALVMTGIPLLKELRQA
jgi:type IV secretory pathway VirB2 component (pilin)